jgi:hypothetical protein
MKQRDRWKQYEESDETMSLMQKIWDNSLTNRIVNRLEEKFGEYFEDSNLPIEKLRKEILGVVRTQMHTSFVSKSYET